ncbi:hypothetical protein H6F96_03295 [Microcoleus sp. FACHB-53]|nr:hypothetical protein [Microcoleus sp. FACHB-53]MBD2126944.1 hypothetical protein [Microcoleus sp. FACHB-1]
MTAAPQAKVFDSGVLPNRVTHVTQWRRVLSVVTDRAFEVSQTFQKLPMRASV